MKKFVVVDDDPDDIDLFTEAMAEVGKSHQCYAAKNGKDLLHKLNSGNILEPDMIFLDINMPEMNGWDCLIKLKGNMKLKHLPVIMYSTSSAKRDAERAVELGALGFFEKPANFIQLKDFLKHLTASETLDKNFFINLANSSKTMKLFV